MTGSFVRIEDVCQYPFTGFLKIIISDSFEITQRGSFNWRTQLSVKKAVFSRNNEEKRRFNGYC